MTPRLTPLERPTSILLRFAYWASEQYFGKVVTPLKVFYARKFRFLWISAHMGYTLEKGLSLEPSLLLCVRVQASRLNGCAFCQDLALAEAIRHRLGVDGIRVLSDYPTNALFSARERVALTLVEEMTVIRSVSDETWLALRDHFSETEIVELVWVIAAENYWNLQSIALRFESDGLSVLTAKKRGYSRT